MLISLVLLLGGGQLGNLLQDTPARRQALVRLPARALPAAN
jgi:hypothetical protein